MIRPAKEAARVEFLNLVVIFLTACLVLRKPQKERLAFGLFVFSVLFMVFLFAVATRTGILPGVNY
jgi:heme O synthase-like polyprenyltransferase